jgi:2-polyprenyl-3-methyl-5-hydroxy-6-metoxy-1,4-benzoquinol methylase
MLAVTNIKPVAHYHDLVRTDFLPFVPHGCKLALDFGGGIGGTALAVKRAGKTQSIGVIDMVPASQQLPELDFRLSGDFEDLEGTSRNLSKHGPFDLILCLDVLEHLTSPWDTVRMLHGLLRPGGYMVASIPNVRNYKVWAPLLFKGQWQLKDRGIMDHTHLRFFVKDSAIELMTSSGMTLDLVEALPDGGPKTQLLRMLTLGLFNVFTDQQYMVRVRNTNGVLPGRSTRHIVPLKR